MALSAANLSVCGNGTHLLQSGVFISNRFRCQVFTLTGSHLFHWQSEWTVCSYLSSAFSTFFCFCMSVFASVTRSLLLSTVWVSHEPKSLLPSLFSLSTQLLVLAYIGIWSQAFTTIQFVLLTACKMKSYACFYG